jgi:hypothetical protein
LSNYLLTLRDSAALIVLSHHQATVPSTSRSITTRLLTGEARPG